MEEEFVDRDLSGVRMRDVNLTGARMHGLMMADVKITNAYLLNADIDGYIGGLKVNGVEVAPLVEAELNRRHPERAKLKPTDPAGARRERMTVRLSQQAPINDPTSFYRPVVKVAHRGDPAVVVGRGNHALVDSRLVPLHSWHPLEVLHFPLRSRAQWTRIYEGSGVAWGFFEDAGAARDWLQARVDAG